MNSEKYYTSIENFPLYNWIKCNEKKDKKYTRRGEEGSEDQDLLHWDNLYSQYIDEFGLSKYYKRLLEQYKKKATAELNHVVNEDKFQLTIIEMETKKLEQMLSNGGKGIGIEQTLIHLSKWIGYWIKSKEISVKDFFALSQEYDRYHKLISNGEENKQ